VAQAPGMKGSWRLNIALAAVVAALALFVYFRPRSDAEYRLSQLSASAVNHIRFEVRGQPPVVLERKEAGWFISSPVVTRADPSQVQTLLAVLGAASRERYPASGLARFDLNEPYARLAFNDEVLNFGAVNEMSREQYVLSGNNVYLIALRYGAALPRDALQLASKQLFGRDEAPTRIELPGFTVAESDGRCEFAPAEKTISSDDCNRWLTEWRLATASQVMTAPDKKPIMTVNVRRKDKSTLPLAVLESEPDVLLVRTDEKLAYRFAREIGQRLLAPPIVKDAK
jgi:hypothetical protein